jgi:hypothetical protein
MRPLALVGPASDRVLSGETIHWQPGAGELVEPSPLLAWSSKRGWRGGPSVPFELGEVSRTDVSYFSSFPQPTPTVDRYTTGVPPRTYAGGWNGMRYLIRARALGDAAPGPPPSLEEFLGRPALPGEGIQLTRSPVRPGDRSGIKQSSAEISLPRAEDPAVERWLVELVEINAWGEISGHLAQIVARDVSAPRLVVQVPSFTPPWPFAASLHGEAESGATVSVAGSGSVRANRLGRFTVPAQLAPWPQTIEVRAVDRSGNESVRQVSVVGGFDYRQLPWALIGTLVLVAVLALGPGRRTTRRAAARAAADMRSPAQAPPASSPEGSLELDEDALAHLGPLDSRSAGSAFIEDVRDSVRTAKVRGRAKRH